MIFEFIFITVALLIVGSIVIVLYRIFGGEEGKNIDWNKELSYPHNFRYAVILALIGYHVGIHSYLFIGAVDYRFPTVGWMIFALSISLLFLTILWSKRNIFIFSLTAVIALSGLLLPFRANGFVQSINIVMSIVTSLIGIYLLTRDTPIWTISKIIRETILYVPLTIIQTVRLLKSFVRPSSIKHHSFLGWFKTLIITFIVLFFFIALLSNADPIFSQIIKEFREQLLGRTIASIIILIILSALLSIIRPSVQNDEDDKTTEWLSYRDIMVVASAVVSIIAIFLFVQFKYLFGGSKELLQTLDLTYSEYVRKGFIELLIATFAGGCISYIFTLKTRKHTIDKSQIIATIINAFLILELIFLLVSAVKRDMLYVDTYGLTRVRIVGGLFLLWLFGFLATLGLFTFKKNMKEARILLTMWILSIVVWGTLNVVNIDRKVAQGAPGHHAYTDYFYLIQLSEDAYDQWDVLLPKMESETKTLLQKESLSDIDEAQLAGLKLGLITFIEKRDRLYRHYASDEWLLKYGWKLGDQFEKNEFKTTDTYYGSPQYHDDVISSVSSKGWHDKTKKREINSELKKQRTWAYENKAEQKAFGLISSNESYYFDTINQLLRDIRSYQIAKQLSLWEHENRLLNELKYPFISVALYRYRPEDYSRKYIDVTQNQGIFDELERKAEWSVPLLAQTQCSQPLPASITVYGVVNRTNDIITPQGQPISYLGSLSNITNKTSIRLLIPSTQTIVQPTIKSEQQFVAPQQYDLKMQKAKSIPLNSNEQILVHAVVEPQKTTNNGQCSYQYNVRKLTEIMDLMQR